MTHRATFKQRDSRHHTLVVQQLGLPFADPHRLVGGHGQRQELANDLDELRGVCAS